MVGRRVREFPLPGAGSFGMAKCAETPNAAMSAFERTLVKLELRWSKE